MKPETKYNPNWDYTKLVLATKGNKEEAIKLMDDLENVINELPPNDLIVAHRAKHSLESALFKLEEIVEIGNYNPDSLNVLYSKITRIYFPLKVYCTINPLKLN